MPNKALLDSLDMVVRAMCLDYSRREKLIASGMAERRVDNELRYLNFKIFEATSAIVGEGKAALFISEIGKSVGYANSDIEYMSEGMYKRYKSEVKNNIAKNLYLC